MSDSEATRLCPDCSDVVVSHESLADHFYCAACDRLYVPQGDGLERAPEAAPPSAVKNFLFYTLSLPERTVRSGIGVVAGAARETAAVLVPQSFQTSKTYEILVGGSLKFLCEGIGGVESQDTEEQQQEDFLARKAVGNFVELAGLATLHLSPIWLFAVVSDVAYGSSTYVKQLAEELKQQGLIDETSRINHVDDLLTAVQRSTGEAATLVDTPPLSMEDLRASLKRTKDALRDGEASRLLPEADLKSYWASMQSVASQEDVSLLSVSSAITMQTLQKAKTISAGSLAGVKVAGGLFNEHVLGHYRDSLTRLREKGFYPTVQEVSAPYIAAVWHNYAPTSPTWTDEFLSGRAWSRAKNAVAGWWAKRKAKQDAEAVLDPDAAGEPESVAEVNSADDPSLLPTEHVDESMPTLPEENA